MTPMEELDPVLIQLFDAATAPLPQEAFLKELTVQIRRTQRRRILWSALAVVGLALAALLLALPVARASLALVEYFGQGSPSFGTLLLSPLGTLCAMLASLYVLRRARSG